MTGRSVIRNELTGQELHQETLPSGLRLFLLPKPGFRKFYAVFAARYGSLDSRFVPRGGTEPVSVPDGIAHFLEHKLFEKEDGDVFERFAETGAQANAFTSYTQTAYLFSCTSAFEKNLELLVSFVLQPYFTEAGVAKEQGIIEQELRMYEDHPQHRLILNLLQALYWEHPVRIDIGGTVDSIKKITRDLLYLCYETFYHPGNMALAVAGDFDPAAVRGQVARLVEGVPPAGGEIRRFLPPEPEEPRERWVESGLSVSQPLYALGFKDPVTGLVGRDLLARELAIETGLHLLIGPSSDLYEELYQEGLIDDDFRVQPSIAPEFSHVVIGGETPDPRRLHEGLTKGLTERLARGFDDKEVERARRRTFGEFIGAFDSPEFLANAFLSYGFRKASPFWLPEVLESVDAASVGAVLQELLTPERAAASVVLPHR